MLVINPMTADTRVDKEAAALAGAGYDVTVVATLLPGLPQHEDRDGFTIVRLPYRHTVKDRVVARSAARMGEARCRAAALSMIRQQSAGGLLDRAAYARHASASVVGYARGKATWALGGATLRTARTALLPLEYWQGIVARVPTLVPRCDVIHAHDLGPLAAAVRLARQWERQDPGSPRPKVMYDSHELYVEQFTKWLPREKRFWSAHERLMIRRADAVITVSDGIAHELQTRYALAERPRVVLNSPPADSSGPLTPARPDVRVDAGVGANLPLAVYAGAIKAGRGVDELVAALAEADFHLAVVGSGTPAYLRELTKKAADAGAGARLHLLDPVPAKTLTRYLSTADVGVHPLPDTCLNHRLALPNKLFDYVFSGLPVVVADLPEMARFVSKHGLGATYPSGNAGRLGAAIVAVAARDHAPDLHRLRSAYGWERQGAVLQRLYGEFVRPEAINQEGRG